MQATITSLFFFSVGDEFNAYLNFDPELEKLGMLGKCGVEILVRRDLNPTEIKFSCIFQEAMWVKIKLKGKDELVLGMVYRSPNADGHQSTEALCALLGMVHGSHPSHPKIVADFNFQGG